MSTMKICTGCQKPLEANVPDGLCPECLLKAGLGTGVDMGPDSEGGSGQTPFVAPSSWLAGTVVALFCLVAVTILAAQANRNDQASEKRSDTLQVRCVDVERRPVSGAKLAGVVPGSSEYDPTWRYHDANGREMVTDTNGVAELRLNAELRLVVSGMLYARQEKLHLAGWLEFSPGDFGQTRELVLQPECRVRGRLRSPGL